MFPYDVIWQIIFLYLREKIFSFKDLSTFVDFTWFCCNRVVCVEIHSSVKCLCLFLSQQKSFRSPFCLKIFWKLWISPRVGWCSLGWLPESKQGRQCGLRHVSLWNRVRVWGALPTFPVSASGQPVLGMVRGHLPSSWSPPASMGSMLKLFFTQEALFFCRAGLLSRRQLRVYAYVPGCWGKS